jgi:hypothetical protein
MHWYEIDSIEKIDSPSLIVYASRAKENINKLIEMVGGNVDQLRPHVKTNKIAEVCQMMMDKGIRNYKCATIAEAEMLGILKTPNVLIAHQLMGLFCYQYSQYQLSNNLARWYVGQKGYHPLIGKFCRLCQLGSEPKH